MHIMNIDSGYVGLGNENPQHTTVVPIELMHLGEHFNNIPQNVMIAQHWQSDVAELPWTTLFQMIVDGHRQQPTRNICS